MHRRYFILLLLSILCLTGGKVYASGVSLWNFYTSENNDTTLKNIFDLNDDPYAYLFVNKDMLVTTPDALDITWTWYYLDGMHWVLQETDADSARSWSANLDLNDNFNTWEPLNAELIPGRWKVDVKWLPSDSNSTCWYTKTAKFTVTPEPLGCSLFALGSGVIALLRRKRRA